MEATLENTQAVVQNILPGVQSKTNNSNHCLPSSDILSSIGTNQLLVKHPINQAIPDTTTTDVFVHTPEQATSEESYWHECSYS